MANKKNTKKNNNKNKKKNLIAKSPLPTAESISNTPPSPQSMVNPTSDSRPSTVNPVSDSPKSPLSPRPPLPPVFFNNTVILRSSDMTYKMRYEAYDIVDNAFKKHLLKDKEAAEEIKKEFDKRHGRHWHCILGASYESCITSMPKRYIRFYMSHKPVLLFKHG